MIYLRLQIEPVFRVPGEVTRHYEADVMIDQEDLDRGSELAAELLRDQGWHVTGVRQAAVSPAPDDIQHRPRLSRLLRQAELHGTAYLLRYRDETSEPAPVRSMQFDR